VADKFVDVYAQAQNVHKTQFELFVYYGSFQLLTNITELIQLLYVTGSLYSYVDVTWNIWKVVKFDADWKMATLRMVAMVGRRCLMGKWGHAHLTLPRLLVQMLLWDSWLSKSSVIDTV